LEFLKGYSQKEDKEFTEGVPEGILTKGRQRVH
jgi:hypothetical protein